MLGGIEKATARRLWKGIRIKSTGEWSQNLNKQPHRVRSQNFVTDFSFLFCFVSWHCFEDESCLCPYHPECTQSRWKMSPQLDCMDSNTPRGTLSFQRPRNRGHCGQKNIREVFFPSPLSFLLSWLWPEGSSSYEAVATRANKTQSIWLEEPKMEMLQK